MGFEDVYFIKESLLYLWRRYCPITLNPYTIMSKSIFYHAGCPVCVSAEESLLSLLNPAQVEVVHLGVEQARVAEARAAGVQSVPALVTPAGHVLHLNFGAALADLSN